MRRPSPTRRRTGPAVALACAALLPAQDPLPAKVERALTAARPVLLEHLRIATEVGLSPGEEALLTLAAIHDGVPADEPRFAAAIAHLAKAEPTGTYDLALRLLVLEAWPTFPGRAELARADLRHLLDHQTGGGGFSYGPSAIAWDLSNTQYAALGLRAAKAVDVPIDRAVWSRLGRFVAGQQDTYGGFGYTGPVGGGKPGRRSCTASMTAAGIAVLAICTQAAPDDDKLASAAALGITRGWGWFRKNVAVIGAKDEGSCSYFHYGLERAAILTDVVTVADQDWWRLGAEMFVATQEPGGGWANPQDPRGVCGMQAPARPAKKGGKPVAAPSGQSVSTAFAVLFLRRKFQKFAGPVTPRAATLGALGPDASAEAIAECAQALVKRGKAAAEEVVKALRSDVRPRREAAAAALAALAGQTFGFDPAAEPSANAEAIKRAELWFLRQH